MASLNQVSIELQVKGEREATQALKRYSDASDRLNRSVLDAASKVESTTNAWNRANKLYEKGVLNAKALQTAQTQLARELAVTNGYLKSNGALNTQKALAEIRAAQATQEAAAAEAKANAERQRAQQSYNQLRASIDQSYAARMRLKQAADTLRAAERNGIITREQAIEQLRRYRTAAQAAAQGGGFMGRSISRSGVLTQQAGYQVGDFIVQLQSGTNVFVAFGQQATQVAGTLTLLGGKWIGIGTALGIAIPLLTAIGAGFMRAGGEAKSFTDILDELETAISDYKSAVDEANASSTELNVRFGTMSESMRPFLKDLSEIERIKAFNTINEAFDSLQLKTKSFRDLAIQTFNGSAVAVKEYADDLGLTIPQYEDLSKKVQELRLAETSDERVAISKSIMEYVKETSSGLGNMTNEMLSFYENLLRVNIASREMSGLTEEEEKRQADAQRKRLEMQERIAAAEKEKQDFAQKENNSLDEQIALLRQQIDYGKESVSTKQLEQQQAERAFEAELKRNKLGDDEIKTLLTKFGLVQSLTNELVEQEELELKISQTRKYALEFLKKEEQILAKRDEIVKRIVSKTESELQKQQDRIALAQAEIEYGKESAEYKAVQMDIEERIFRKQLAQNGILGNNQDAIIASWKEAGTLEEKAARIADQLSRAAGNAWNMYSGLSSAVAVRATQVGIVSGAIPPQALADLPPDAVLAEAQARNLQRIEEERKKRQGDAGGGGGAAGSADNLRQSVDRLIASYDEQYAKSLKVAEATKLMAEAQMAGAIPANMSADKILQDYIASLEDADDTMSQFVNDTASQMSDAFMSIVDGSKSASDAFGDMARAILKQAFELAVINPIINSIFGGVSGFNPLPSLLGSANGNAFSDGRVVPFANGGVVSSPTMFPMRGAQVGLMGEAGPEAIMPLKRGKGGKLGVVAEGASQPVVIHQNFNFSANGDDSVKRIIAQEAPKIASLTQKQILDQRARGGAFKTTFG